MQLPLPDGVLVRMEALLCQRKREEGEKGKRNGEGEGRERDEEDGDLITMHVQSLSHWAPANIGPYSQAVKVGVSSRHDCVSVKCSVIATRDCDALVSGI